MKNSHRPILVTGIHRSGSTWIGTVISSSAEVNYIHEPFNLQIKRANPLQKLGIYTQKSPLNYWFEYFDASTDSKKQENVLNYVKSFYDNSITSYIHELSKIRNFKDVSHFIEVVDNRKKVPLIKDPLALMSSEFFANELNARILISIRHPAAFVASILRKNWRFNFNNFLEQERLLNTHLSAYKSDIIEYTKGQHSLIDEAILLWNIIYSHVDNLKDRHADWYYVKHETISENPIEEFCKIFDYFELKFTEEVLEQIKLSTSGEVMDVLNRDSKANIKSWKKILTESEIARIKKRTHSVANKYYSDDSWN